MDIAKAIIAGIAVVLSALLTLLLKEYFDRKRASDKYENLEKSISEAVNGKWKGYFEQTFGENNVSIELMLDLKVSLSGSITGKAKVPYQGEIYDIDVKGGFYSQRFLKMDYENSNKAILQFGAFVFKLSDDSQKLIGYFVGYGHKSGKIIGGNAKVEKV